MNWATGLLVLGLASWLAWKLLSYIEAEEEPGMDETEVTAHLLYTPRGTILYVHCSRCDKTFMADDGRLLYDGFYCADCLVDPGDLEQRVGNVIYLDDYRKRRAS